jgi:hypothetical protein
LLQQNSRAARIPRLVILFLLVVGIAGCGREGGRKPYVARVDRAELTDEDLSVSRDSLGDYHRQSQDFVNDWIVNELLYQEAIRRGLTEGDEFLKQMEATKRHLAIEALLDREIYAIDTSSVSEQAIASVYTSSAKLYALRQDVVNASYVLFSERDPANAFRSKVLRGTSWDDAMQQAERDSLVRRTLRRVATRQYFTQSTLYPEELWKLARTLGKEDVSFVVKTNDGFCVLKAHGMKRQGDVPDLAYVRNEIRDRLLIEQRKTRYDQLIADLRAKHTVDIRIDHMDTASTPSE